MKISFSKPKCLVYFISSVLIILGSGSASAKSTIEFAIPDSSEVQIMELDDGSRIVGRITDISGDSLIFRLKTGELRIYKNSVKSLKLIPVDRIIKGKYWFPNPNYTRLYFAPTARMLERGSGYFSDYYIFFPGFAYGITNNITFGGGMSLLPGVKIPDQIFYITPKVGLKSSEKFSLAGGALIISFPNWDDDDDDDDDDNDNDESNATVGILYGVGTLGTKDHSLTLGLGYGFAEGELADKPMVMLGGEARLSRGTALVTENWIMPGTDAPLISYGIRFFGESISVDLALITPLGEDAFFPGIPYIDFVVNF